MIIYRFFITRVDEGAIQLTDISMTPCLLQMAMLNLPKFALMILILCSSGHVNSNLSLSHL